MQALGTLAAKLKKHVDSAMTSRSDRYHHHEPRPSMRHQSSRYNSQDVSQSMSRRHSYQQPCPPLNNSTLKRRIARSQSERKLRIPDGTTMEEPEPDYPIDYELADVSWNPEGHSKPEPLYDKHKPYKMRRDEEDLLKKLDPNKIRAVLRFMEAYDIDPYVFEERSSKRSMDSLRRSRSIDHLELSAHYAISDRPLFENPRRLRRTRNNYDRPSSHRSSLQDLRYFEKKPEEVEYGPGIVEKLRAKFTKLSGLASKSARVSTQVTCKRCPSVDDILSDKESQENKRERAYDTLDRNWGEVEKPKLEEQEPYRAPLMRGSSVDPAGEARKRYIVHRQVLRTEDEEEEQDVQLPSISTLRRKFEENASRSNWENKKNYHQTPTTLPVVRSQSAERSYSPSLLSPGSIPHSAMISPCPEPTYEEKRPLQNSRNHSPNNQITSPRRVLSPEPARLYSPRETRVLREKQPSVAHTQPRPRSMDVASEVLEVLNRAQPGVNHHEDRSRTMVRSATAGEINERTLSPTQPTLMLPPRRPAPLIPEVSSGARVVSSHAVVHPPTGQPSTTLHMAHTLHRPTNDYRLETTTLEYREDRQKNKVLEEKTVRPKKEEREKEKEIFISPPDPDSARDDRPALFSPSSANNGLVPPADASPPPEEPKPPVFTNRSSTNHPTGYSGPKILPSSNDLSGKEEMKRLLSRFNQTRDKKLFEEANQEKQSTTTMTTRHSGGPPGGHTIHTTVIQTYDQSNDHHHLGSTQQGYHQVMSKQQEAKRQQPPEQQSFANNHGHYQITGDNVTNISVRTDSPAPGPKNLLPWVRDGGPQPAKEQSPTRRPAPPPPPPTSLPPVVNKVETDQTANQIRKSLSAQFLEQQARLSTETSPTPPTNLLLSPKPYGDDATIRMESEDEGTEVSENGDLEEKPDERRGRASTSDSAVSVNSSQSDYSVEEEEPIGTKAKYTFAMYEVNPEKEEEKKDFDRDSLEENEEEESKEIPNDEAIQRHLRLSSETIQYIQDLVESDSEDDEPPPLTLLGGFPNQSIALMAGDGNPVRNSLISLVMEEDIPMLLEAMSENPKFEFIDLLGNQPSTSSILHPPEKRKQRRTERQVSRISFVTGTPDVFTYLDERSAERESQWVDGAPVPYEVYQSICTEEQQEQVRQLEELERWKQNIQERQSRVELEPDDSDCARGVTSHLSYQTSLTENSRISV